MSLALNWPAADIQQTIDREQVHVWAWSIDPSPHRFDEGELQILDASEQERYHQYHFDQDRVRFALAHVHLRRILAGYLHCQPDEVTLRPTRYGKPAVDAPRPIYFNLSHSRQLALLAVSIETEVGVDVEDIRPIEEEVAHHYFSPVEQAALSSLEGDAWLDGFYRCWTRKEAIVKAEGVGLQLLLSSFDVSLLPDVPAALLAVRPPAVFRYPWTLHHLDTPAGTVGALAAGHPLASVRCFSLAVPL